MKKDAPLSRYDLAYAGKISSHKDIVAFAKEILFDAGYDVGIVNIKEEGISVEAFTKLVRAVYDLGYREGYEGWDVAKGTQKRMLREGKALKAFGRTAKQVSEQNLLNK